MPEIKPPGRASTRTAAYLASITERLLGILFPPRCPICGEWIEPGPILCAKCRKKLPAEPPTRRLELSGGRLLVVMSPMRYREEFRKAVISYKFYHKPWLSRPIGALMAELLPLYPERFDMVVYSPTSFSHRMERGFDQSRLLAERLARREHIPVVNALRRSRRAKTQHELSHQERLANASGAYRCIEDVKGRSILLVDDVMTTGSTMRASAEALYMAGARTVYGICGADAAQKEHGHK